MRRIPATMATQHPDNAGAPYWDSGRPFIAAHQEITEATKCFSELGVREYMWDWEGKHADAAVIDRLFTQHHDYFSKHQLGRDVFLTFRIPNVWQERGYNLLQAMTVLLSSEDFARDIGFRTRPLFEVILPMTERADQLIEMQKLFEKLAHFKSQDFTPGSTPNSDYLELIPLVENVESQLGVADLLKQYVTLHKRHFGHAPAYIRGFLACSDSALSSGFLAARLGNKLGLARLYEFAERTGIPVYPITGSGSLPFRGGLTPYTVERFIDELPGVRTVTLQSAFRYDYPLPHVKRAITQLEKKLPAAQPLQIEQKRQRLLESIAVNAAGFYKHTVRAIAKDMQPVFAAFPRRRDRHQHIGLVSYARSMEGQSLPRAITFTGSFYSIGVPPEFIGLGRALEKLSAAELRELNESYPHLADDVALAGRYVNRANLAALAGKNKAWQDVAHDIEAAERLLKVRCEPDTPQQHSHQKLSSAALNLLEEKTILSDLIETMGTLRSSLG